MRSLQIPAQRQQQIVEYIKKHEGANIKELAKHLGVSEATVRRDLDNLAEEGEVERTHGGAVRGQERAPEYTYDVKMELNKEEKTRIAKEAAKRVRKGDKIYLGSGTTVYFVAKEIAEIENLTIITSNLYIAQFIPVHPSSSLIVTGGERRYDYNLMAGTLTENFLRDIRVDISILGCDAIDVEFGVSDSNVSESVVKSLAAEAAGETLIVTDHSKFGKTALSKVFDLSKVDYIITDKGADEEMMEAVRQKTQLILV
ncbi:MAG: DeoR/GlpR family DNA-binding transcription regulator [Lachnospiraceae bacterium]